MKIHLCRAGLIFAMMIVSSLSIASAQAQTFTTIYSFQGPLANDGGAIKGGVVLDSAGDIYGTATVGGSNNDGVLYKIDAAGHETVLYNFTSSGQYTASPGQLIRDTAGNLYGTTYSGDPSFHGMVFIFDATDTFNKLYSFKRSHDGRYPYAGLSRDGSGNLYGTTLHGGSSNQGIVFKVDAIGNETILHDFTGGADGGVPYGDVIRDSVGTLYGTTSKGGSGFGTVFKIDASGQFTTLHTFAGGAEGGRPFAGVNQDSVGNLYGVAANAGDGQHFGVVFQLDSSRKYTVLHSFDQGGGGRHPVGGLARDASGNLYGTCIAGGDSDQGTVFMITSQGKFKLLHTFSGRDGSNPQGRVTLDGLGNLYGTTYGGGASNFWGTVFKVAP
jgi:uncharacterized repeat protein (TIGR03803 family)